MLEELCNDIKELLEIDYLIVSIEDNAKKEGIKKIPLKNTSYFLYIEASLSWKKLFYVKNMIEKFILLREKKQLLKENNEVINNELFQALNSVENILEDNNFYLSPFSCLPESIDYVLIKEKKILNAHVFEKATIETSLIKLKKENEFSLLVKDGELFGFKSSSFYLLLQSKKKIPPFLKNIVKIRLLWLNRLNNEEQFRVQNQRMIQQSSLAQMGEMISIIAHQWKQPLTAISSTSANLQLKIELENFDLTTLKSQNEFKQYFKERFENIDEYICNLSRTMEDFRNFFKPNKKPVLIRLEEIITKSLKILETSFLTKNIKIIKEYHSQEKIELHDNEITQVILNILKNAEDNFIEKSIKNPFIKIRIEDRKLFISDNGGGVEEDIIEHIFNAYFSTKSDKQGTGLGLYISKMIVEEHHNGKIKALNHGDGICFSIEL